MPRPVQVVKYAKDELFLGRTVDPNKNLRFLSASSIDRVDTSADGGCHTKWWFEKVAGKKAEQKEFQKKGEKEHVSIAHYESTGEDVLSPIVRPGKHFLPAPGKDLIIEHPFGDYKLAIEARDAVLKGLAKPELVDNYALTFLGIPLIGEMDLRHRRGEWTMNTGLVVKEDHPQRTAEIVDWKTTSDIAQWGKKPEDLYHTVQMSAYAKATTVVWPDIEFVRISHGQFGTRRREAQKVSALLDREAIDWRYKETESLVLTMTHIAREPTNKNVERNLDACSAYRGCDHQAYCDRPKGTVAQLFQIKKASPLTMSDTLFGTPPAAAPVANGAHAPAAPTLFSAPPTMAPTTPSTAPTPMAQAEWEAAVAAEKARLQGLPPPEVAAFADPVARAQAQIRMVPPLLQMTPTGHVFAKEGADQGWIMRIPTEAEKLAFQREAGIHDAVVVATPNTPPVVLTSPPPPAFVSTVNPPGTPPATVTQLADALPPEVIAQITDPALKARAETHAAAHAIEAQANKDAAEAAKEKTKGRCPGGAKRIVLTQDQGMTKKANCPDCGKELKLRPAKNETTGVWEATLAGHNITQPEAEPLANLPGTTAGMAAAIPAVPATLLPSTTVSVPPVIPPVPVAGGFAAPPPFVPVVAPEAPQAAPVPVPDTAAMFAPGAFQIPNIFPPPPPFVPPSNAQPSTSAVEPAGVGIHTLEAAYGLPSSAQPPSPPHLGWDIELLKSIDTSLKQLVAMMAAARS